MNGDPSPPPANSALSPTRDSTLRVRAVPTLVLLLAETLVGNELAVVGSPYPLGYLAAHVVLSLLLVGFTAHIFLRSLRLPSAAARVAGGVTFLSTLGATISGSVFLWGGGSQFAVDGMEGLAGLAILGAILLLVFGSVVTPSPDKRSA